MLPNKKMLCFFIAIFELAIFFSLFFGCANKTDEKALLSKPNAIVLEATFDVMPIHQNDPKYNEVTYKLTNEQDIEFFYILENEINDSFFDTKRASAAWSVRYVYYLTNGTKITRNYTKNDENFQLQAVKFLKKYEDNIIYHSNKPTL
ncbi:MAG: hypothetical protein Q8876_02620 [Bacillota bacterium]|nr:hypothetical protein [Bacillota bacterium]